MATKEKTVSLSPSFTIYNASAGSGKTYTLAVQYIARLLATRRFQPASYRQVLAVTFTNKATAEMKDRILQQLYGVSEKLASSESYLRSISAALRKMRSPMSDDEIRDNAHDILYDILHDYSHFRVETIDTFFRAIFTDMARELGLPAGLRADIDQKRASSEAVDRIIERLESEPDIRRWITQFVRERMDDGDRWDVTKVIKEFAEHLFDLPYLEHQDELNSFLSNDEEVKQLRKNLASRQQTEYTKLEQAADAVEQAAGGDLTRFSYQKDIVSHLAKLRAVRGGGDMPKLSARINGFAEDAESLLKKADKQDAGMQAKAEAVKNSLAQMIEAEKHATMMFNSIVLTRQNLNQMRLLNAVGEMMNRVTQERGTFLLANTPLLLNSMVKDGDTPFMYEKTGSQLRHIMLDEFQDTSGLQWSNFQTLINENMAQDGSTLVVGDIKQSIYRWRGGDWKILDKLQTERNVQSESLSMNYRSARRIIGFNNLLYMNTRNGADAWKQDLSPATTDGKTEERIDITKQINALRQPGKEAAWDISAIYANARQEIPEKRGDGGFVQVTQFCDGKPQDVREQILKELCRTIRTLIDRGHEPSQIAILVRRKKREMDMVAKAFAEYLPDLSLVSDEIFRLNQSTAVNILINALRVILHPDDHASLGRLVYLYSEASKPRSLETSQPRGPEASRLRSIETPLNSLYDSCTSTSCFEALCSKLPKAFSDMESLRRKPVFELVMSLAEMFGLAELPGQSAYLMTFYDNIMANICDTSANLTSLLNYWDDVLQNKSIPGGEVEGVNILTIHRAKGLQWKTVLIPFCDWTIHDYTFPNSIFWSKPHNDEGLLGNLPIAAVPLRPIAADSIYQDDYMTELQNQRVDNLNLLYVATTRPEDNLYIWGYGNEVKNGNATMMTLMALTLQEAGQTAVDNEIETGDEDNKLNTRTFTFGTQPTPYGGGTSSVQRDSVAGHPTPPPSDRNRLILKYDTPEIDLRPYPAMMNFRQSSDAKRFTGSTDEEQRTPQQDTYINTGQTMHAIFAHITSAQTSDDDIRRGINALPDGLADSLGGSDKIMSRAKSLLKSGLKNPLVADWFSGRYNLHNECNIVARNSKRLICTHRPDRVMSDRQHIIVVDYKFGKPHNEHVTQVQGYMALLKAMYPDKTVKGYLWYVYSSQIVTF